MEAISLKCPHCGTVLTVPDTYIGRTSKCGRCRLDVFIKPPRDAEVVETGPGARTGRLYALVTGFAFAALVLILLGILASYVL